MPTELETTLWKAVNASDYSAIEALLRDNPDTDLINTVRESSTYSLAMSLISDITIPMKPDLRGLLDFVLTHPKLNWGYTTGTETAATDLMGALRRSQDYSLLDSVRDVPGFFISNDIMSYDVAKKELQRAEKMLNKLTSKNPKGATIGSAQAKVERCHNVLVFIRDITILHAIKTDNAELMERLDQSGACPLETLGEAGGNRNPFVIIDVEQPNPRIVEWRTARLEKATASRGDEIKEARSALRNLSILAGSAAQITAEYDARELAILDMAAASSTAVGPS